MFRAGFLLLALPLAAQPQPDAQLQHFNGPVQTVTTYTQLPDFERPGQLREPVRTAEQTFDEQGWDIGSAQFDQEGHEMMRYSTRRKGGCVLEQTTVRRFPPEAAERIVALGTDDCRPKETSRYKRDGTLIERTVVTFEGDTIRQSHYDGKGQLTQQLTHKSMLPTPPAPGRFNTYERGQLVSSTRIAGDPEKFDAHTKTYGPDGKLQEQSVRTKTEKGYSNASVNKDGTSTVAAPTTHGFDSVITINGETLRTHTERDEKERDVEIDSFSNDKLRSKVLITYEEDERGNWTKKTMKSFEGGQFTSTNVSLRTITYY